MTHTDNPNVTPPPALSRGHHLMAEDGMCLMEAVSVHAGLPWSDRPGCTNPSLAELARLVNDAVSEARRDELWPLVPRLSVLARTGIHTDARIVRAVTRSSSSPRVQGRARTMERWVHVGSLPWLVHASPIAAWLVRQGPARRALEAAVESCASLPVIERDAALFDLLRNAIAAADGPMPTPTPS